ncbi:hypothetical protein DVA85_08030 [Acinetobacter sp. RIT592]|nr:hypothetical protein DVA85_08030 [Acinetobacter sp. RIT592]
MLSNKNVVVITKVIDNIGQFCKNNVAMIFCIAKLKDFLNHLVEKILLVIKLPLKSAIKLSA